MTTALRTVFTEFVNKFDNKELKKGQKNIDNTIGKLKKLGGAMAAAFSVKVLVNWVNSQTAVIDTIGKTAIALNLSFDSWERLSFIMERTGSSADAAKSAIQDMNEKLGAAKDKTSGEAKALKELGTSYAELQKLEPEEQFLKVIEMLQGMKDPQRRAFLGNKILGGSFKQLAATIAVPVAELRELGEEHEKLGGGYSDNANKAAQKFRDLNTNIETIGKTLSGKVLEKLLPSNNKKIEEFFTELSDKFGWLIDNTPVIKVGIAALGATLVAAGIAAVVAWAPFLIIGFKIIAVVALIGAALYAVYKVALKVGEFLEKFDIFGETQKADRPLPPDLQKKVAAVRERSRKDSDPVRARKPSQAQKLREALPAGVIPYTRVPAGNTINQTNHTKVQISGSDLSEVELERAVKGALAKTHRDARAAMGQ